METLSLNVNLENLSTEERETLMKLVEKSQEKKSKVWKPELGERYYTLDPTQYTQILQYTWSDDSVDNKQYEYGEIYKTIEEAEEELTRRKMLAKWKRLSIEAGEEENEWAYNPKNDNWNIHWYVYWDTVSAIVKCGTNTCSRHGVVYFPTAVSILNAIKELGEENVKKYILGVRD